MRVNGRGGGKGGTIPRLGGCHEGESRITNSCESLRDTETAQWMLKI